MKHLLENLSSWFAGVAMGMVFLSTLDTKPPPILSPLLVFIPIIEKVPNDNLYVDPTHPTYLDCRLNCLPNQPPWEPHQHCCWRAYSVRFDENCSQSCGPDAQQSCCASWDYSPRDLGFWKQNPELSSQYGIKVK